MRNILLTLCFLAFVFPLHSDTSKFYNVNSLYGISMRGVTSVCKDKNGFVWASSKYKILRLVGDDYRIYHLPYENVDFFSVKLDYTNGGLYAYTNNGQIFCYNTIRDKFDLTVDLSRYVKSKSISISSLLVDGNSRVHWFSSQSGLFRYKNSQLSRICPDKIYKIARKDQSTLIVASVKGVFLLDKVSLRKKWLFINRDESLMSIVTKLLFVERTKQIWIGTLSKGLFIYNMNDRRLTKVLANVIPKQPILAIDANCDSSVYLGIDGQGVWELNSKGTTVLNVYKDNIDDPSALKGNGVYDIFCDNNKRVWVCTYTDGVSFFDQSLPQVDHITHIVNAPNSLANNNVNKVIQDRKGNLWFATDNGVCCKESGSGVWKTFYQNKDGQASVFLSLCEDDQGRIWSGTYSSGIYVLDENTGKEVAHYSKDTPGGLESNYVLEIFKDSQGDIWIGGIRGKLICFLSKENRFRIFSTYAINAFYELSANHILFGGADGLYIINKNSGTVKPLLLNRAVQDMTMLNGVLWICTSGEGLIKYDYKTSKTQNITVESGLPSNYVNSILFDSGYLWLGTESGLCRLAPDKLKVLTYNSIYLLSRNFYNRNSHFRLKNGQLIWGTNNGAISFFPGSLTQQKSSGAIFFQELTLAGRSIRGSLSAPLDSLQELTLNYTQNNMNLELIPLGDISGSKFSWMLSGVEKSWSHPSGNRVLNYSNLQSGEYELKIRLYDSSLSYIIAERSLKIKITPPFWGTWWFRLVLFVFITGVVYLLLRYYLEQLRKQQTEEKVRFFTNTAHDFRTSLTLIKGPLEELTKDPNLLDASRHYLALAREQVRRLSAVVTQLMDFQKMDIGKEQLTLCMVDIVKLVEHRSQMFESLAKTKNINLRFTSDQPCYQTAINESMIDKAVDNLISNAIKYSHTNSLVQVNLVCNPESWSLEVIDQGIGISKIAQNHLFKEFYRGENAINSKIVGSGIGLLLVKNYIAMHGGKVSCVSQEDAGSTFKVTVPFKEVYVEECSNKIDSNEIVSNVEISEFKSQAQLTQMEHTKPEMRILIVEDNDDLRDFMRQPLQDDFDVLLAENGLKAWEIIQKQMPDLVVSDIMMPEMDGFELCRLMKSTYETSHIPLILLSALTGKAEQLQGLGLGADDYLTKPFDMSLLAQRIKSIIRNREAVREKALKLIKVNETQDGQILSNELNDKFVKKMLKVVWANIENVEFGKEEFAAAMNVSASLLYRKVKSLTDQSPTDFIKTVRLDYALELLQSRKYSVTEVSEMCGFSSIGYFGKVFKKHYGKAPTEL